MVTGLHFDHECFHCKECCFRNLSAHFWAPTLRHCKMEVANTLTNVCLATEKVHIAFGWRCSQAWHRILLYRWTLRNQSVCQSRHSDLYNIGCQLACNLACHSPACVQTQCVYKRLDVRANSEVCVQTQRCAWKFGNVSVNTCSQSDFSEKYLESTKQELSFVLCIFLLSLPI